MCPGKASALLLIGLYLTVCGAAQRSIFLTGEGKLTQRLELRDGQEGFVGTSGKILTIEPSGSWSAARFVNEKVQKPDQQGQLTPQELAALAKTLEAGNIDELPPRLGRDIKANPRLITLHFGGRSSTLVLDAGESLDADAPPGSGGPQARSWVDFITIAKRIQNLLKVD